MTIDQLGTKCGRWYELTDDSGHSRWEEFDALCATRGYSSLPGAMLRLMELLSDGRLMTDKQVCVVKNCQYELYEVKKQSGYRAYVWKKAESQWVFLVGGHKGTQKKDIALAIRLVGSYLQQT